MSAGDISKNHCFNCNFIRCTLTWEEFVLWTNSRKLVDFLLKSPQCSEICFSLIFVSCHSSEYHTSVHLVLVFQFQITDRKSSSSPSLRIPASRLRNNLIAVSQRPHFPSVGMVFWVFLVFIRVSDITRCKEQLLAK